MARRPTRFERDLADLHGDAEVEIVEISPGPARYRVVSEAKPFMADYPPFVRVMALILGVAILGPVLVATIIGIVAGVAAIIFGVHLMAG